MSDNSDAIFGGLKKYFPQTLRMIIWKLLPLFLPSYRKVQCNICGWRAKAFWDYDCGYGRVYFNAECPVCRSHPRHRSLVLFLQKRLPKDTRVRVLHFAPERCSMDFLQSYANVDYLSVDFESSRAMRKEDIEALSFAEKSFDVIICLHVLEHVIDDRKAMRELFRVLSDKGFAIIDVPIDGNRAETYEDFTITSPEARTKAFWQHNHVRLYGRDFPNKLENAGFKVSVDRLIESLGQTKMDFHGLRGTPFHICTR
jgi:SAM-dependent methyltransferase